jgi:hypothetical protein
VGVERETKELVAELATFRRCQAAQRRHVAARFGPRMRAALGLTDPNLWDARIQPVLHRAIKTYLQDEADAQLLLRAAFALEPEAKRLRCLPNESGLSH